MKESLAVNEIIPIYKSVKELDFEKVISSHSKVMWNKNILDTIIANLEQILAGTYFYDSSTNAEIEGYKTTQITYSDQNYDSVILIRITSELIYRKSVKNNFMSYLGLSVNTMIDTY